MTKFKRHERSVQLAFQVPISMVNEIDSLLEATGLSQSELLHLLITRGLDSWRTDPRLAEIARVNEIRDAKRATK